MVLTSVLTAVTTCTGNGRVVYLTIDTPDRFIATSFSDIIGTLSHGSTDVHFYNNYRGNETPGTWEFPEEWTIPHFWDEEIGGDWTLYFEDEAHSSGTGFYLTEWCLEFEDPSTTAAYLTTGSQAATATGAISDYNGATDPPSPRTTYFETMITDSVNANGATPTLLLSITHASPTDLSIELIAADGTIIQIKDQSDATIPASTPLTGLTSDWLTGRYQLSITDHVDTNSGTLTSWSIDL